MLHYATFELHAYLLFDQSNPKIIPECEVWKEIKTNILMKLCTPANVTTL